MMYIFFQPAKKYYKYFISSYGICQFKYLVKILGIYGYLILNSNEIEFLTDI